jgi:RimJ/RimL family protein N-acetyltransferase
MSMRADPPVLGPVLLGPRVRVEPIGRSRALALLAGTPQPDLPWEKGFPLPPLLAMLRRLLELDAGGTAFGPFFAYAIVRSEDGRAVGDAGFHGPPDAAGEVEIGYALTPAARGAGLATESVGLLCAWALEQPAVAAVAARVRPWNAASLGVLARLGFQLAGEEDGHLRLVLRA